MDNVQNEVKQLDVEMNMAKTLAIIANIDSKEYTDEEKAGAICLIVLKFIETEKISKESMLAVIKWLFDREWVVNENYEVIYEVQGL